MHTSSSDSTLPPRNAESQSHVSSLSNFTVETVLTLRANSTPPQTPPRINVRPDDLPDSGARGRPAAQDAPPVGTPDRQITSQSGTPWRRVQAAARFFNIPAGNCGRLTTEIANLNAAALQPVEVPASVVAVMREQARLNELELLSGQELDTATQTGVVNAEAAQPHHSASDGFVISETTDCTTPDPSMARRP